MILVRLGTPPGQRIAAGTEDHTTEKVTARYCTGVDILWFII
ncbi:hypothetical protein ACFLWR_00185 [Chloroflexota bacterium]